MYTNSAFSKQAIEKHLNARPEIQNAKAGNHKQKLEKEIEHRRSKEQFDFDPDDV